MWQRAGGKDAPENNLKVPVAAARTTRPCFNGHDDVVSQDGARNAGEMSLRRRM